MRLVQQLLPWHSVPIRFAQEGPSGAVSVVPPTAVPPLPEEVARVPPTATCVVAELAPFAVPPIPNNPPLLLFAPLSVELTSPSVNLERPPHALSVTTTATNDWAQRSEGSTNGWWCARFISVVFGSRSCDLHHSRGFSQSGPPARAPLTSMPEGTRSLELTQGNCCSLYSFALHTSYVTQYRKCSGGCVRSLLRRHAIAYKIAEATH
jgi:hypothetical protein